MIGPSQIGHLNVGKKAIYQLPVLAAKKGRGRRER